MQMKIDDITYIRFQSKDFQLEVYKRGISLPVVFLNHLQDNSSHGSLGKMRLQLHQDFDCRRDNWDEISHRSIDMRCQRTRLDRSVENWTLCASKNQGLSNRLD